MNPFVFENVRKIFASFSVRLPCLLVKEYPYNTPIMYIVCRLTKEMDILCINA